MIGSGLNMGWCGFDLFFHFILRVKTRYQKGSSLIVAKNHQGNYLITGEFILPARLRPGDKSVLWRSLLLDLRLNRLSSESETVQEKSWGDDDFFSARVEESIAR